MVKQKIIVEEIKTTAYQWKCPKCDKVIIGSTPQQVEYNGDLHLDSHKEKSK